MRTWFGLCNGYYVWYYTYSRSNYLLSNLRLNERKEFNYSLARLNGKAARASRRKAKKTDDLVFLEELVVFMREATLFLDELKGAVSDKT